MFVQHGDPQIASRVAELFRGHPGIGEILTKDLQAKYGLLHERSGEVVLISDAESWQAYYWWLEDSQAPSFARTVDIHRKPGYDPVELHFDPATKSIPLDATLVRGSHGAPATDLQRGIILCTDESVLPSRQMKDIEVAEMVLEQFGMTNGIER